MPVCQIKGSTVAKNRDGEKDVLLLEIEISEPEDLQTGESMRQAGIDSNPPNGSIGFVSDAGEAWKIVVAVNDNIKPDTGRGEIEIYSSDGSTKLAKVRCTEDSKVRINDGEDNAVRYSKLEEAFNQLKADHDALVTAFIAHVHPNVTSGTSSTGPTVTPAQPSSANIAPAKIDDIEVP